MPIPHSRHAPSMLDVQNFIYFHFVSLSQAFYNFYKQHLNKWCLSSICIVGVTRSCIGKYYKHGYIIYIHIWRLVTNGYSVVVFSKNKNRICWYSKEGVLLHYIKPSSNIKFGTRPVFHVILQTATSNWQVIVLTIYRLTANRNTSDELS